VIFDHIGLFVADLDYGRQVLSKMLPIRAYSDPIDDPGLKVRIQFCTDASGVRYELVAPFGDGDPVTGVLESGKAIINHVAYCVPDLKAECNRLRREGAMSLTSPHPAVAFGGRAVVFLLTPLRFIVELIEAAPAATLELPPRA
jgi:methylmalonyl-CoA/ethylmalonyl-CoA epimerase